HPGRRTDWESRHGGEPGRALDLARAQFSGTNDRHHHARPRGRADRAADGACARRSARAGESGMSLLHTIETGLRSLLGHRLRSVLTTLGILFGVAAVISTVGIGQASSDSV